jgi:hypothetical protein
MLPSPKITKCIELINYVLLSVVVTIILSYSILTADYSYAQEISPSNLSAPANTSNSSFNNNNTQMATNNELEKQVQNNQLTTIPDQKEQVQALPSVKITSHTQNQDVPAGTVTINGISSDTPSDICTVYIILNNIKPYQKVTPVDIGNGQSNDFSSWKYTFTPAYATIKEGTNKMTSKISCDAPMTAISNIDNNLTKFNSLNVTGIATESNNSSNNNSNQLVNPLTNSTFSDPTTFQSPTYNTSQNAIYSPLTPSPTAANPLSTNGIDEDEIEDNEIQSSNEQGKEINSDETNEDDDNANDERSGAREVFEIVEERLRDSGIDFDISSMLD